MVSVAEYIGAVLLIIGIALTLAKRKRQFDCTNRVGVEKFLSHWAKLSTNIKAGLLRFILLILLSAGLLILGFWLEDSWGCIVTLPVYAFMLFLLFGS
jgi:ACR3 family arsenite efflux pump ArsB